MKKKQKKNEHPDLGVNKNREMKDIFGSEFNFLGIRVDSSSATRRLLPEDVMCILFFSFFIA